MRSRRSERTTKWFSIIHLNHWPTCAGKIDSKTGEYERQTSIYFVDVIEQKTRLVQMVQICSVRTLPRIARSRIRQANIRHSI